MNRDLARTKVPCKARDCLFLTGARHSIRTLPL